MTRILDRYVSREFMRLFLLFAIAAPVLFVLGDLTDNLDKYIDRGLTAKAVGLSYVYQFPLFVLYSFPIASLIATIFTVYSITRHSELAAAKAGIRLAAKKTARHRRLSNLFLPKPAIRLFYSKVRRVKPFPGSRENTGKAPNSSMRSIKKSGLSSVNSFRLRKP